MSRWSLLPLLLLSCCDFFADDGFPCAVDGSCPGGLFCVDDVCRKDAPARRGGDEGEGDEGEGEGEVVAEGEGEVAEGEGEVVGEGEGEVVVADFVFARTLLDVPELNIGFAAARDDEVAFAGVSAEAVLGQPQLSGEDRLFFASGPIGGAMTLRAQAVTPSGKIQLYDLGVDDGAFIASGFVSGTLVSDVALGACHLSDAGRLSVFSARFAGGACDVAGRVTAVGTTAVNVMRPLPFSSSGARSIFGVQVSTNDGAVFDFEVPAAESSSATDYGTLWIDDDGGVVDVGSAGAFFLGAADAATGVVGGTGDALDGEAFGFLGAGRAPQGPHNGIVGFAAPPSRSLLFNDTGDTSVLRIGHAGADPVVAGGGVDPCDGVFVARLRDDLQGDVWTAPLCTGGAPLRIDALVVDDDEVLLLFFAPDTVTFPDGQILAPAGVVAAAFDVDSGSLVAIASAFDAVNSVIVDDAPADAAFGAATAFCGDAVCAISAHRHR
jgi:hypothetical protein